MAKIVGGFLMPHDPLMVGAPQRPPPETAEIAWRWFDSIARRIRELRADTIIVIGDDHYAMFGPNCIPSCLIGIGDVEGPLENWLGLERRPVANNEALARHILKAGYADGIGWSFAKSLVIDHSTAVPYHLALRAMPDVRMIPIYLNDNVQPFIPNRLAFDIGRSIARAVAGWAKDERVVVFGTGGCSHWIGEAETGRVNEEFDGRLMALLRAGDIEGLMQMADEDVLQDGGNGAIELKNWICAMGAVQATGTTSAAYAAVPEWLSGIAFAELACATPAQ